jgi:D-alanine--poly(phosphoribitol) ligase subunit 1
VQVNILEYLENGAARNFPGKTAIVDGASHYTFAQLADYAQRCAALLIARADVVNQPIAVLLPKSAATIFADLGIVYSGNIYANLDVKSPALRIKGIVDLVGPVLIVTSSALAPQLEAIGVSSDRLFFIEAIFEDGTPPDHALLWKRLEQVIDTDPLCIIHTSGSTGIPKGVVLSHRGTIDFMDWCFQTFQFSGHERIGSLSPLYFDIYTLELHLCLAKGATLVLIPDQLPVFPARLMQFLANQAISFLFWVPSIMVNISSQGLLEQFPLAALRTIFFAGEVFPMKHLNHWRRSLPLAAFVNLYGPIEITVDCTYFPVDREFFDDELLPIGFPCRNSDILILDEQDQQCAGAERGELCVRGTSLALGYWNNPEKTAAAFVQNPLNTRYPELIYRTGDIAYRNDRGEIMLVGRKDFQIKHLGYRIELPEIEYQALRIEGITNACVLYNKEKKEIALFYESNRENLTPAVIRRELAAIFPKYMLPTAFHAMAELPRNPNGKIDRNGLSAALVA